MKKVRNYIIGFSLLVIFSILLAIIQAEAGVIGAFAIAVFTRICEKNVGGNAAVYLAESANITTVTVTAGEISALTMVSGKMFHEAQQDMDSLLHTQVGVGNASNVGYTHRVEMRFAKPSMALNTFRDSLAAANACGILAIVTDSNGESWLVGYNETDGANRPLRLKDDGMNTGVEALEEGAQAVTIALEGVNGYLSLPFDDTLKATIIAETATFITYA